MADHVKHGFDWLVCIVAFGTVFLFSMVRLPIPSWAQSQRETAASEVTDGDALDDQIKRRETVAPGATDREPLDDRIKRRETVAPGATDREPLDDQIKRRETVAPRIMDRDALDDRIKEKETVAPKVTDRDALRALDDQIEILIKRLSDDREFDQRTIEELRDLDSIVAEYLGENPQMAAKITIMPLPKN